MTVCLGVIDYASCPVVVENDDSIGGEGEITCGAQLIEYDFGRGRRCADGHRFEPCQCGRPVCTGWKVATLPA